MNILSQTPQVKAASPKGTSGMKILFRIAIVLMFFTVAALIALVVAFDSIVKKTVEVGGTTAMGVDTTVESVDVGFTSGSFEMKQMHIANPEGYEAEDFFTLGTARLQVDAGSFSDDTLVVPEILIEGVTLSIEQDSEGANYKQILDNLKRFESKGSEPAGDPSDKPTEPAEPEQDKKFIVKSITMNDVKANVKLDLLGKKSDFTIAVPNFTIDNIGNSNDSQSIGDLLSLVLQETLDQVVKNGGGLLPENMVADIKGQLGDLTGGLVDDLKSDLGGVLDGTVDKDDLKETAKDTVEKAKEGLKGLLGKD